MVVQEEKREYKNKKKLFSVITKAKLILVRKKRKVFVKNNIPFPKEVALLFLSLDPISLFHKHFSDIA